MYLCDVFKLLVGQIIWHILSLLCTWVCITSAHMPLPSTCACWFERQLLFIFQYVYSAPMEEYAATINVRRKNKSHIDSAEDLYGEDCSYCASLHVRPVFGRCNLITYGSRYILSNVISSQTCFSLPCFSHSVQLFSGATGLQPMSHCWPQVRLRLVRRCWELSLCVSGLLQRWGPTHLPRTCHPLCMKLFTIFRALSNDSFPLWVKVQRRNERKRELRYQLFYFWVSPFVFVKEKQDFCFWL